MLTLLWALPGLGALLSAAGGRRLAWTGPLLSALALVLGASLWPQAGSLLQSRPWIGGPFAVSYSLGLSGLSLLLVLLTLLITTLTSLASLRQGGAFIAWMQMLGAAATGMFLSRGLVLFYVFWELMLVPAYFLLVGWGGAGRGPAAWKFLLYNIGGSVALLLGVAALVAFGIHMPGVGVGAAGHPAAVPAALVVPVGVALFIAFAVKTPLWPLHGWVADTYAELPAPAAALVGAIQSKAGLYGMLAILLPLVPGAVTAWHAVFVTVAVVSLVYGALLALGARDGRRLVAYSSVSHLGLITLAFLTLQPQAVTGGIVQLVAHGLFTAALFLLLGMLESRLGGPVRIGEVGGLAKAAPALAGGLLLVGMAALGLPGLAGFPGELLMLVGIYHTSPVLGLVGGLAVVLAAAYLLRLLQLVLHGPSQRSVADLGGGERWLLAPLAVLLLLVGLWPQPIPTQAAAAVQAVTGGSAQVAAAPSSRGNG